MCSLPGLPTPGSEVPVLITRVNLKPSVGVVELWVSLDVGKRGYEQMKEQIQIPNRKFSGPEGKAGDLCLVCIRGTWHRARIVSNHKETCSVFLIDQGQPHVTTSEALAWGQDDSFLLPPEMESCILANVRFLEDDWPETATEFVMCLPGNKFKGLVQHVLMPDRTILLDIPIVSEHLYKLGVAKKIPAEDFKSFVLKCRHSTKEDAPETNHGTRDQDVSRQLEKTDQYYYPELSHDTYETVVVTEVTDPKNIYCKFLIFSKALKVLSEQIHQHYQEASDVEEAQPHTCGDPCAARGTDGRWHRSILKQNIRTHDEAVEVLHVDEGKTERTAVGDIRPLHGKFLQMPVFTCHCSLNGVNDNGTGWTTSQTDYLKSVLLNKVVVARFEDLSAPQNVHYVTLYEANGSDINHSLLKRAGLFPSSITERYADIVNDPVPASFFSLLDQFVDSPDGTSPKNPPVNGRADDVSTSGSGTTPTREESEQSHPPCHKKHLPVCGPTEVQGSHHDDGFPAGTTVNVNVSCIESLQRFWCQITENSETLAQLMEGLRNAYASAHLPPLVESVCVARNPDDGMWYRAKIITSHHSPVVEVRFIDYGQKQKVPLKDVRPIDPAFLQLNAQAFQCSLFNQKNPTDAALMEFKSFVDSAVSSPSGLKCIVKATASDEEGLLVNMVDIESPFGSACKLLAQKCTLPETQVLPPVPSNTYSYATHDIEVGGKEKVWITSSENVNHFYCQLDRNFHLIDKLMENVKQLIGRPQCAESPLELGCVCLARYPNDQWYRGQVVEMSPKLRVHFVDFGDTVAVNRSDVHPFPTNASLARSVPVQAVPLGLFTVPTDVPQEVSKWFSDHAVGQSFTISVVAKGEGGKLIVELFEGSVNVNVEVIKRIERMKQRNISGSVPQVDRQLSDCPEQNNKTQRDELKVNLPPSAVVSAPAAEHGETSDQTRNTSQAVTHKAKGTVETLVQNEHSDSEMTQLSTGLSTIEKSYAYKKPSITQNKMEDAYASCISGPNFLWCQFANTENLNMVLKFAQEVAQTQTHTIIPKTPSPGSPCLALYSSDNQWYRAQVVKRTDKKLKVVFIDYGNESEVDVRDVRSLPDCLLELPPQAFLCSLSGFDESKGSWDDEVYEDFYNLLIDKPLRVTALNVEDHPEIAVPRYTVKIERGNVDVSRTMLKHWKLSSTENRAKATATLPQVNETESNFEGHVKSCHYKKPMLVQNKPEEVYASCVAEPHFFWCQYADTRDLSTVTRLAQEAGQAQRDMMSTETLGPGSPCLALFSPDNQWYRAQVIHRVDGAVRVVFIDYGNEADVEINHVRSLPLSLLELAPQAFLCSLNGFDCSQGCWDDAVYDDFYGLLVNKPLKMTPVVHMEDHSDIAVPHYAVQIECEGVEVNAAMQKYWNTVAKECNPMETSQTEVFLQDGPEESTTTHLNVPAVNTGMYRRPEVSKTEVVYASCVVAPSYFWCQYADGEDLSAVSRLTQEAGQAEQDLALPDTLGPHSPCLALYCGDHQWYRAQVICRTDGKFQVLFIDYGNESEVDIKDVRPLPPGLLELPPQAFLCSLKGFDESKGSWDDEVYDAFYNLLINKPLRVTNVLDVEDHPEMALPQYSVEISCEGVVVNTVMKEHWTE
ncbi:tudor domain-containing 6 [Aulostomus maculatus]